jgi:large subunit GTPase 1
VHIHSPSCRSLSPHKASLLLLNKADLLPTGLRTRWADYFDSIGVRYAFWSASACMHAQASPSSVTTAVEIHSASGNVAPDSNCRLSSAQTDHRTRMLNESELTALLTAEAEAAVRAALSSGEDRPEGHTPAIGLVGFPNVGKSSTINALFGSKKTAVAATPGKTKHFQTLFVTENLLLCDCPGLVMPRLTASKADMVAAGGPAALFA